MQYEDITIVRLIVEEVSEPKNDGTRGSALYSVPFELSRLASSEWGQVFVHTWDHPPRHTSMHRPGIAKVIGRKIFLSRTTIEEVEETHKATLLLAVQAANEAEKKYLIRKEMEAQKEAAVADAHREHVKEAAKRILFD